MSYFEKSMRAVLFLCCAAAAAAQTLPDGPGKALTERMCTPCHSLDSVVRVHTNKERWANIVDDMVQRGASGSDSEIDQLVAYLAESFPPPAAKKVNVNKASAAELAAALSVSDADAAAIVSYRTDKGSFKNLEDLTKVPGIDAKKIAAAKDRLEF
jgi:competence protein ComEA